MSSRIRRLAVVAAVAFLPGATAGAQPRIGTAGYAVGFRVVHELDHSRTVGPRRDFEGTVRPGELAYPVLIRVWYPARAAAAAPRMTLGDYLLLSSLRNGPRPLVAADRSASIDGLKGFARFGLGREISDAQAAALFARRLDAVRDAPAARGTFPVIVAGTDGGTATGATLFETLASRGYVVIASTALPALAAVQSTNPALAVDARVRDLEYLIDHARRLPFADPNRLGILGINFDGMPALVAQMKNMRADAVVSIDGWEGKQGTLGALRGSTYYDPRRMRVPYFLALQDEPSPPPHLVHDLAVFDALRYGAGEHLVLRGLTHAWLVGNASLYPDTPAELREGHALLARRVVSFIDRYVKRDPAAVAPDSASPLTKVDRRRPALRAVPYAEEVERIVMAARGAERLRQIFRDARRDDPTVELFTPAMLNLFAFRMSRSERVPESIVLRELGTEAWPGSAAAHNDLGNALLQAADTARAAQAFDRALAALPADSTMGDAERAQSRTVIETKLERLRRRP